MYIYIYIEREREGERNICILFACWPPRPSCCRANAVTAARCFSPSKVLWLISISNFGSDRSFADDLTESRYCKC